MADVWLRWTFSIERFPSWNISNFIKNKYALSLTFGSLNYTHKVLVSWSTEIYYHFASSCIIRKIWHIRWATGKWEVENRINLTLLCYSACRVLFWIFLGFYWAYLCGTIHTNLENDWSSCEVECDVFKRPNRLAIFHTK